ncbi:hypothetical protein J1614_002554 [Plenodomus biglobosus]|nr:hypothetical protein J1614_002554 [Plenodomus biglobosus]
MQYSTRGPQLAVEALGAGKEGLQCCLSPASTLSIAIAKLDSDCDLRPACSVAARLLAAVGARLALASPTSPRAPEGSRGKPYTSNIDHDEAMQPSSPLLRCHASQNNPTTACFSGEWFNSTHKRMLELVVDPVLLSILGLRDSEIMSLRTEVGSATQCNLDIDGNIKLYSTTCGLIVTGAVIGPSSYPASSSDVRDDLDQNAFLTSEISIACRYRFNSPQWHVILDVASEQAFTMCVSKDAVIDLARESN